MFLYNDLMKKSLVATFFILIILFISPFFFTESLALASTPPDGIVSLSGCSGPDCTACNVVHMVNGGITWLIGILFVVFAVIMVIAGVGLVTSGGNQSALESAKSKFTNAIIGLIIILSAWLIVDTLMRGLLGNEGKLDNGGEMTGWLFWSQVECQRVITPNKEELIYDPNADASTVPTGSTGVNCSGTVLNLATIPGTSQQALPDVVDDFVRMRTAAANDGITLTVTYGYRSDELQEEIWYRHHCDSPAGCDTPVARPCSLGGNGSNHSKGEALDISIKNGELSWLQSHAGEYGFYNNLSNDLVHWSRTGR